jgi:ribonuclease BN (tRNA processing enzyme)
MITTAGSCILEVIISRRCTNTCRGSILVPGFRPGSTSPIDLCDHVAAMRIEGTLCRLLGTLVVATGILAPALAARQQPQTASAQQTRIVLLGTGNPAADPDRSGPATAIVVNDTAYLVDFGPGVIRRAKAAVMERGITALEPTNLRVAFATHLHSDHTVGYPDLIFSPWTLGRRVPIDVYGPSGLKAMTTHLLEAYRVDIDTRTNPDGNQHDFPDGYKVNAHEVRAGVVYKDGSVTVTAFPTKHAMESYGYRFDTANRSIVISGDTSPTQETIDACHGCDVLIHEVNTLGALSKRDARFQAFAAKYHTSTEQLAGLASKAKPRLLVLYHHSISWRPGVAASASTADELFAEMSARYPGQFVIGRDLDVY